MPLVTSRTEWTLHGDPNADVIIAGDSHGGALQMAEALQSNDVEFKTARVFAKNPEAAVPLDAEYWNYVRNFARNKRVVVVWKGNQHNSAFLIRSNPPIKVLGLNGLSSKEQDGQWISRSALKDFFTPSFDGLDSTLFDLSRFSKVVVVGTPPPKRDDFVLKAISNESYFRNFTIETGRDPSEISVERLSNRVALWEILQEILADIARVAMVPFIPSPESARDQDGALKREYCYNDATHANAEYGLLIRALISEWIREEQ
ncbi:MAG: hypothetical protein KF844_08560 [Cryobacterium sp.]|nr:hypothetical protein [Cryobacterium sp.]